MTFGRSEPWRGKSAKKRIIISDAMPTLRPLPETEPKRVAPERRRGGADRRSTWRGSRRDVDWIKHLEEEAAGRRQRLTAERTLSFSTVERFE